MPDKSEMKLCMVTVYTNNMLTGETEQKLYCVQAESLGLLFECLDGLVELKRARPVTMEQIEAITEMGELFSGGA